MDENLARCALVNFQNLERVVPAIGEHPFFQIALAQLDEALGGPKMEDALGPARELGTVTFDKNGKPKTTGIIKSVRIDRADDDPESTA
jgi:hypothetical protein